MKGCQQQKQAMTMNQLDRGEEHPGGCLESCNIYFYFYLEDEIKTPSASLFILEVLLQTTKTLMASYVR